MKKNIFKLGVLLLICFILSGCKDDSSNNYKVTTTEYPIEYLVSRLYGYNSKITSIYPDGSVITDYKLTDKQTKEFAKETNLFVYNGLTDEKQIAKNLLAKNDDIQIIDVAYGIRYTYGREELWLNPNNYLTLANTVKDGLLEISSSKYTGDTIEENYGALKEELSKLDYNLRMISKNAPSNEKKTICIAYNAFGFLEEYGFNIVNISDENSVTNDLKAKFKDKNYTYILVSDTQTVPSYIQDIVDNYGTELVYVNTMDTLTEEERSNNDNYLTIMNGFLKTLSGRVNN